MPPNDPVSTRNFPAQTTTMIRHRIAIVFAFGFVFCFFAQMIIPINAAIITAIVAISIFTFLSSIVLLV